MDEERCSLFNGPNSEAALTNNLTMSFSDCCFWWFGECNGFDSRAISYNKHVTAALTQYALQEALMLLEKLEQMEQALEEEQRELENQKRIIEIEHREVWRVSVRSVLEPWVLVCPVHIAAMLRQWRHGGVVGGVAVGS